MLNEQTGNSNLFSDVATGSNAEQDQEESSMWQKCPVITFQTFDDLTGLLDDNLRVHSLNQTCIYNCTSAKTSALY